MAGLVLDSSSITTTFVGDTNNAGASTFTGGGSVSSLDLSQSYNNLASASASVFTITTPDVAGFGFNAGTGVYRSDPSDVITGASTLTIDFSGTWTVVGSSFGPTLFNFAFFSILSVIPNVGDQGQFVLNVTYPDGTQIVNDTLTFNSTRVQTINYFEPSTVPSYNVGQTFSLSGSVFFSWEGASSGGTYNNVLSGQVPEPSSLILMCCGSLVLLGFGRIRHRQRGQAMAARRTA